MLESQINIKKDKRENSALSPEAGPETKPERAESSGVFEIAKNEADQAATEIEALSIVNDSETSVSITPDEPEAQELQTLAAESKVQVQKALDEFDEVIKTLKEAKGDKTPMLDEMLEKAEPANNVDAGDTKPKEESDEVLSRAQRHVQSVEVVQALKDEEQFGADSAFEQAVSRLKKVKDLKSIQEVLQRVIRAQKATQETLNEIGITESGELNEELVRYEEEYKELTKRLSEAERAYNKEQDDYSKIKRKRREERIKAGYSITPKEFAYEGLVKAKNKLDEAQKNYDTYANEGGSLKGEEEKKLAINLAVSKANVEFWSKETEIEEIQERINALKEKPDESEELESLKRQKEEKIQESEAASAARRAAFEELRAIKEKKEPAVDDMKEKKEKTIKLQDLLATEEKKLKNASAEYQQASRHLQEEQVRYPKPWVPIQQKYFDALAAESNVSENAVKHARNQIELYKINQEIASLEDKADDRTLDELIAKRDAKDELSKSLAEAFEQSERKRDELLESYKTALSKLVPEQMPKKAEEIPDEGIELEGLGYPEAASLSRGYGSTSIESVGDSLSSLRSSAPLEGQSPKKPGFLSKIFGFIRHKVKEDVKAVTFQK